MNLAKVIAETKDQADKDSLMLKDMANSLRNGSEFLFSKSNMADMLDRLREDHVDHLTS